MSKHLDWRPKTSEIPTTPGVYRWFDERGRVIYVGKAKNLRGRLTSYFADPATLHPRTAKMVQTARDLQWVMVKTEFEALQLEFTWIKEFNPQFNVQFKDDKSYPYLAITVENDVPRVFVTRNRDIKGAKYFGPYTKAWAVRETVDILLKVFPVRSCSAGVYDRAVATKRACLLGDIGKCVAPCVGRISTEDHRGIAKKFASFMSGQDAEFISELQTRMHAASESQNYELAAKLRDQVVALETVLARSAVVFTDQTDADLFGFADDELAAAVSLFKVRGGRIRGVQGWVIDKELDRTPEEIVEYALQHTYMGVEAEEVPKQVLVSTMADDAPALAQWLSDLRGAKVTLRAPQRGDMASLAETANTNARHALAQYKTKRSTDFTARSEALSGIAEALALDTPPLRIECFDVSHLQGTDVVASMVVFEDGLPKKAHYRRFNIEQTTDDTDSIYQVLKRRLRYLSEPDADADADPSKFAYRPSLLIVDGGVPQVNAAQRAIDESGVTGLRVVGIAKRLEEVWQPGNPYPVIFPRASDELFLVQRIRDEAHRFAISFQRQKRRSTLESMLDDIPGLGEKRVRTLLRHFGSIKRVKAATLDELADVSGIGAGLAAQIHSALQPKEQFENNN